MVLLSRFALLSAIAVLLSVSASSQSLPRAPKTEVITVTPKPGYFSEPSIAVNPTKPQQVVAAFQDNAHIAYSADGGSHWQLATGIEPPNYRVSGDVSVTFDNEGRAYICYIAFDKLGTFNYWGHNSSRNGIYVRRSLDGGATFSPTRNIIDTAPTMFTLQAVSRANGFAQIAIDPRGGAKGGRLYLTWSDYRNGDVDVFCSTSADQGETWSAAVRVNDDPSHDGADQFFQWMAVDPVDGAAYLVFYDRRGDAKNRQQVVVLARSTDGGRTFQNYAWMDQPFDAQGVFMGDYNGIAVLNGRVYGVWTLKPENKSSRDTLIQIGIADFSAEKLSSAPSRPSRSARTGRK